MKMLNSQSHILIQKLYILLGPEQRLDLFVSFGSGAREISLPQDLYQAGDRQRAAGMLRSKFPERSGPDGNPTFLR